MRYFAVMLLLAAMGAAGYLAWTGLHQTPEVIPSGEVKTVRVDNFAYASPELVKPENLKVEAPAVLTRPFRRRRRRSRRSRPFWSPLTRRSSRG